MRSTTESGHAKNVANFNTLIASCLANADRFNPSNKRLTLDMLKKLLAESEGAVGNVNNVLQPYNNASNEREIAFKPLSKLVTSIYNSAASSGMPKQALANLVTIKRKLQGTRATPKLNKEAKAALKAKGIEKKEASSSQLSFDNQIDNFDKLIKALSALPEYNPNEPDLKVAALQEVYANLKKTNDAVLSFYNPLKKARTARNTILYAEGTGLVDIGLAVKTYIKSVDTVKGPWYKQISKLTFKRQKKG